LEKILQQIGRCDLFYNFSHRVLKKPERVKANADSRRKNKKLSLTTKTKPSNVDRTLKLWIGTNKTSEANNGLATASVIAPLISFKNFEKVARTVLICFCHFRSRQAKQQKVSSSSCSRRGTGRAQ